MCYNVDRVIILKVCILGTGAFGIALASVLDKNKKDIIMWSKFRNEISDLETSGVCDKLDSYNIPKSIKFTNSIKEAIEDANLIIIAVPANYVYDTVLLLKDYYKSYQHICIASKGMEESRGRFLHEIVSEILNTDKIGIISGPSFAIDIVNRVPVGVTLASKNSETSNLINNYLSCDSFKLSISNDMIGVSLCGCLKNIIAIGSGIIDGMGYPISSNCLLISMAIRDIKTIINKLGGNQDTILELAGVGDIILTCTSTKSRNYSFGKLIGEVDNKQVIDNYVHNYTVEGVSSLINVNNIVDNLHIDAPFIKIMYDVVLGIKSKEYLINYISK